MTANQSLLDRFAELVGIERSYADALGTVRKVPEDTLRAFLRALGFPADTEAETRASLSRFELERWSRPLEPVQVVLSGSMPARVAVTLPVQATADRRLVWHLEREDGSVGGGEARWSELPIIETAEPAGLAFERRRLELANEDLPPGYHRLRIDDCGAEMRLIVAPPRCYLPPSLDAAGEAWGFAAQLYGLRSIGDWGIGDFGTLRRFIEKTASLGAHMVGLSPLHALFPCDPGKISPYSPSSRQMINILYLDVDAVPDLAECAEARARLGDPKFRSRIETLRQCKLVDYPGVGQAKQEILELLWGSFAERHLDNPRSERGRSFRAFLEQGGKPLRLFSIFEALAEHFSQSGAGAYWAGWPAAYRDPGSAEVTAFAERHRDRVLRSAWLQWLCDLQLGGAAESCRKAGMPLGLYADLAVGVDGGGADAWGDPDLLVRSVAVGAPPDSWNMLGQDWGLPPWNPLTLRQRAYQPFIDLLRANMRHAAALRIDHIMSLMRLYWIPAGAKPDGGGYIAYPLDDLLAVLALESRRNRCMVVGEALGTVPPGFTERLEDYGILAYRLLYFERNETGEFLPPARYPRASLVAVTTHDLATLAGFWRGRDLEHRHELGLFPDQEKEREAVRERERDRRLLVDALEREHVLGPAAAANASASRDASPELIEAAYRFLARSRARLVMVAIEDALGVIEQANLPGTVHGHPNWRQRLPVPVEELHRRELLRRIAARLRRLRPWAEVTAEPAALLPPLANAIPRATYRLQLGPHLTFAEATSLIGYLDRLGVSHIYCSSYLKARSGSTHGYDIVDHENLNPEIGDEASFRAFTSALQEHAMGQVVDVVPNHIGIGKADNRWWLDVLEWGRASPYAAYFDIDWERAKPGLRGKVLIPVLGRHYGEVLTGGELTAVFDPGEGTYSVWYGEHRFPISPPFYRRLLERSVAQARLQGGVAEGALRELESLVGGFGAAPRGDVSLRAGRRERERGNTLKSRLAEIVHTHPDLEAVLRQAASGLNGTVGDPRSFGRMHRVLQAQHYRLAYWRVAADEINYRRFFDINDLAGLRMEAAEVFAATHRRIFEWVGEGRISGLRIDHVDGLYDPKQYLERLQERARTLLGAETGRQAIYIVVEKILAAHERLRDWPIAGTTGYDFLNQVNGLFIDPRGEARLDRFYRRFSGREQDFDSVLYDAKTQVVRNQLAGELAVLAEELDRISEASWMSRDYTTAGLRDALREVVAAFPVYRSYVAAGAIEADDRRDIAWAVSQARKRSRAADRGVFDFIASVLNGESRPAAGRGYSRRELIRFASRFQQYTGPAMAKGLEDTAFYRYNRLLSLNEVGGDPRRFGVSPPAFHRLMRERERRWPHGLSATATHDTKRGEDVRARLNLISEIPEEWRKRVRRWATLNVRRKTIIDGAPAPSANDEYHLYQVLLGSWPLALTWPDPMPDQELAGYRARLHLYLRKALREGKEATSWENPDEAYEQAAIDFATRILDTTRRNLFLENFRPFAARIAALGMVNGLAQTAIKLAAPGVPDLFQGTELWDLSLVDPDNRRDVDYQLRQRLLERLPSPGSDPDSGTVRLLYDRWPDGTIKLHLTNRLLELRRRHELLFKQGGYEPCEVIGERSAALFAFARTREGDPTFILAVPRLVASLWVDEPPPMGTPAWGDTGLELPRSVVGRRAINWLTGEVLEPVVREGTSILVVADLFRTLPVAALLL